MAAGRAKIRDVFDLEFILRKGINLDLDPETANSLLMRLQCLKKHDFDVKLGSLLMPELRNYYRQHGFSYLSEKLSLYISEH